MLNWPKNRIRQYFLKKMLELVDLEDILIVKGKKIMLGGYELDSEDRKVLVSDANYFQNSFFWKRLEKHLKWSAYQQALGKNDLKGGQDIMLTLKLISDFLNDIQKKL